MFYIIGLFLIIGLMISGFTGTLPFDLDSWSILGTISKAIESLKDKTYNFVFPKSDNEILVENLNSSYSLLDRFFSKTSDAVLKSKDISESEKESFKQALETFQNTKNQIKILSTEAVKNEPGIIKSLIKKTIDFVLPHQSENGNPDPTHIPPSCTLVCGN